MWEKRCQKFTLPVQRRAWIQRSTEHLTCECDRFAVANEYMIPGSFFTPANTNYCSKSNYLIHLSTAFKIVSLLRCKDLFAALQQIKALGIRRVLTSGGMPNAVAVSMCVCVCVCVCVCALAQLVLVYS